MFKAFLTLVLVLFFASCSQPKPDLQPSWYLNPPSDYKSFFAAAKAKDVDSAKKIAINSLRVNFIKTLDDGFKNKND